MTATITRALNAHLNVIAEDMTHLTKDELVALGTRLVELTDATRALWKTLARTGATTGSGARPTNQGPCRDCGRALSPAEHGLDGRCKSCHNTATEQPAPTRELLRCTECGRRWTGNELVIQHEIRETVCGVCLKGFADGGEKPKPATDEQRVDVEIRRTGTLVDGTYTVEFQGGDYRTLRVQTQEPDATFAAGKTIVSYLNGPDNWTNYQGFAFLNANGTFNLWKRFQNGQADGRVVDSLKVLLGGKMADGLKAYGIRSGKCGVCGRKLTTPESLKAGIGPVCAEKLGV